MATSRVLVLYTGGTFGMEYTNEDTFDPAALGRILTTLRRNPYLHDNRDSYHETDKEVRRLVTPGLRINGLTQHIVYDVEDFGTLLFSSNMEHKHWQEIATYIKDHYAEYTGFVIITGTDTMAYAGSAVSFMLQHLNKPVVFTGAQIPIFESSTDGLNNLLCSLIMATQHIPEVMLCFNKTAFRANRTIKIDSVDVEAYASPNMPSLATVDMAEDALDVNLSVKESLVRRNTVTEELDVLPVCNKEDVGMLMLYPGISADMVVCFVRDLKGVVLLSYGAGNMSEDVVDALEKLVKGGDRMFVNITSCLKGGVATNTSLQGLVRCGLILGGDMTPQAAFTKLSYVLATNLSVEERKKLMLQNLRGEITVTKIDSV
ncbi:60 kDa lysophospholipase-like isoform X2 [Haliotis rufescens]|uniref:60 kDa lysophospholipase-like isoform X2 n=1 Tax=Haliotis rufescens TaxID=6454 RepID=UPI00201F7F13|nr:60 kDa lysophospholipase-like isoform X2 [Haliotis rufescens]